MGTNLEKQYLKRTIAFHRANRIPWHESIKQLNITQDKYYRIVRITEREAEGNNLKQLRLVNDFYHAMIDLIQSARAQYLTTKEYKWLIAVGKFETELFDRLQHAGYIAGAPVQSEGQQFDLTGVLEKINAYERKRNITGTLDNQS